MQHYALVEDFAEDDATAKAGDAATGTPFANYVSL